MRTKNTSEKNPASLVTRWWPGKTMSPPVLVLLWLMISITLQFYMKNPVMLLHKELDKWGHHINRFFFSLPITLCHIHLFHNDNLKKKTKSIQMTVNVSVSLFLWDFCIVITNYRSNHNFFLVVITTLYEIASSHVLYKWPKCWTQPYNVDGESWRSNNNNNKKISTSMLREKTKI